MPVGLVNGNALSYEDTGTGPPVVLLGGPYRAALLRAYQVPVLTKAGFRVITLDHRGVAPSDTAHPATSVEELASDVAGLVEQLELGRCAVVGDFLGALVAIELAVTRPDLVRRMVLSAARTTPSTLCRGVHDELIDRLEHREPIDREPLALLRALELFSPRGLADDTFMTDALRVLGDLPPEQPSELGPITAGLRYEVRPDRLATITVPCLVLAYEFDAITPPHQGRELAAWIPGAKLTVLDLGHGGLVEDPEQAAAVVTDFIRVEA
jgi:pimeloyl-ACP methyl ester carboxylesterase